MQHLELLQPYLLALIEGLTEFLPISSSAHLIIPSERRAKIIDLITEYDVTAVFTGHLHMNNYQKLGNTELVSTGPVGFPIGNDPSGIRYVQVNEHSLNHKYSSLTG